jgi:ABC-type arginine transport system permease subunit
MRLRITASRQAESTRLGFNRGAAFARIVLPEIRRHSFDN